MFGWFKSPKGAKSNSYSTIPPNEDLAKASKLKINDRSDWKKLEDQYNINLHSYPIFEQALRHRSARDTLELDAHETYERIEFLGDAVVGMIVAEKLYLRYPTVDEGFLTKLRSKIVKKSTLALLCEKTGVADAIEIGERSYGKGLESSQSVRADLFESFIGALYLTHGHEMTSIILNRMIDSHLNLDQLSNKVDNYKSLLLEYCQMKKIDSPQYKLVRESGPGHNKVFEIVVKIDGKELGSGTGSNKKQAEQRAAKQALIVLDQVSE